MPTDDRPNLAFTISYSGLVRMLVSDVFIQPPVNPDGKFDESAWKKYKCIWDTGATGSAITSKVAEDLGLLPTGKTICRTAGGEQEQNTHLVAIKLLNGIGFPSVRVTEANIQGFDVLIGMDIICRGDLAITHPDGKTKMSFQWPSRNNIDFVEEIKRSQSIADDDEKRKARNKRKRLSKKHR